MTMKITSKAFGHMKPIPPKYTCKGEDINPPLEFDNPPEGTVSLVMIMDDPDAPMGTWDHWILWNIDPKATGIAEATVPKGALQGKNTWGRNDYGGPCPPSGTHRYFFKLYALDCKLQLAEGTIKGRLEKAMEGHILGEAELVGLFSK